MTGLPSRRSTNEITSCLYTPNGRFILLSRDLKLYIFDAKTYKVIESDEITVHDKYKDDYINSVCCTFDSQYVVASTSYGSIWWWKYATTASPASRHFLSSGCIHEQGLGLCCTFDMDFHLIVGSFNEIRVFDFHILSSMPQNVYNSQHGTYLSCCVALSDKFVTSGDGSINLWSCTEAKIINTVCSIQCGDFMCLSPKEDIIAVYGSGSTVELRDSSSLECYKYLVPKNQAVSLNDSNCLYCCISATRIVACGYESGHIFIFYGPSMDSCFVLEGHDGEVRWLCFSPDGLVLVSGIHNYTCIFVIK